MNIYPAHIEEARVEDSRAGFHQTQYGSIEVFWADGGHEDSVFEDLFPGSGWYWWAGLPGCLPDSDPHGPFSSSIRAYYDAIGDE